MQEKEKVNHPSHYNQGGVECIDVMIETQGIDAVRTSVCATRSSICGGTIRRMESRI